ncbi:MAG: hypothetical protein NVV62_02355 [Terricaulis sp.]|nr:hypothetical protein [Terricaulis sp.]
MASEAFLAFEPADETAAQIAGAELERNGWSVVRANAELRADENRNALIQAVSHAAIFVLIASPRLPPAARCSARWRSRSITGGRS